MSTLSGQECQSFSKIFFQEHGFPFCFSSAAWDLPVRLLPAAALFFPFLFNAEAHRSVISLTGEQYLYYVSFHCFVSPDCLFFLRSGVPRPIRQKPKALPGFLRASGPSFSSAGNTSRPSDTTTSHLHPSCPIHGVGGFFLSSWVLSFMRNARGQPLKKGSVHGSAYSHRSGY